VRIFLHPRNSLLLFAQFILCLTISTVAQGEAPSLTRLYPCGGSLGTTVAVTASGKFPTWPVQVDCHPAGLQWKPAAENGKFEVSIPSDAKEGIYLVRFYDAAGASSCKRFIVDHWPQLQEVEPNNVIGKSLAIPAIPHIVYGVLEKGGDVDVVRCTIAEGQTLVATLDANRVLRSPLDALLQVVDAKGNTLAQNIDAHGLDPQVVFKPKKAGDYFVRIMGFPESPDSTIGFVGNENCQYRLTLSAGPHLEGSLPLAVQAGQTTTLQAKGWNIPTEPIQWSVTPEAELREILLTHPTATGHLMLPVVPHPSTLEPAAADAPPLALPSTISGSISKPGEKDTVRFTAPADKTWRFSVESKSIGYSLDPLVLIQDSAGKTLQKTDDTGENRDPQFNWKAPAAGDYQLVIQDAEEQGSELHLYRITIQEVTPEVLIKSEADHVEGKVGMPLEVKFTVERKDGFAEPLQLEIVPNTVTPLPTDWMVTSTTSTNEGEAAKQVTLTINAPQAFSGKLKVLARSSTNSTTYPVISGAESSESLWLTVTP
jgi:hypothetical protein